MTIGIDPTVDYGFKLMPDNSAQPNVTIHFLNSILNVRPRITQVEFLNPFLGKKMTMTSWPSWPSSTSWRRIRTAES